MSRPSSGNGSDLREALRDAHLPTLLVTLAHLTGDERWLADPYQPVRQRGGQDPDDGGLPPHVQDVLREEAFETLSALRDGRARPAAPPTPEQVPEMVSISIGQPGLLGPEYAGLMAEELGLVSRDVFIDDPPDAADFSVLIIGSGFSGLCAAAKLEQAGIAYTVIERYESVGGTWLSNAYPGAGVDTPSHLYSLSFAPNPDWSRYYAGRDELHAYLERLADERGMRPHMRFGLEVVSASYEPDGRWVVTAETADGDREVFQASVVICGVGFFTQPSYPDIPGLEAFAGSLVHTARWDPEVELAGKRVAVVGTGASAMQLVPAIADAASHVTVFQRSAQWALPSANTHREVRPGHRWLMREVPFYGGWYRVRLLWLFGDILHPALQTDPAWPHQDRSISEINDRHRQVLTRYIESELGEHADALRQQCVPNYPPYGKRPLLDHGWFRTVTRDDVTLVSDAVTEVRGDRLVTAGGEEHEADVLVLATGFRARDVLGRAVVTGRSGRTLREVWGQDDAHAFLGMAVPDFPNFFFLLGPNTFAAHGGSAALSIEMETRYVLKVIAHMLSEGVSSVEVRQDVHDAHLQELDAALAKTIWAHRGMTTYYRNGNGRIVIPMPWTHVDYWRRTLEPDLSHFHVTAHVR
jgi:4-hydroxyacetophenone monooxygenase